MVHRFNILFNVIIKKSKLNGNETIKAIEKKQRVELAVVMVTIGLF